jgi:hypothetical protein
MEAARKQIMQFFQDNAVVIGEYYHVSRAPLETGRALEGVLVSQNLDHLTTEELIAFADVATSIAEAGRERALKALLSKIKDYLEHDLNIKVFKFERTRQFGVIQGLRYYVDLGFDATPDSPSEPRGHGIAHDMIRIVDSVGKKFPGVYVNYRAVGSRTLILGLQREFRENKEMTGE